MQSRTYDATCEIICTYCFKKQLTINGIYHHRLILNDKTKVSRGIYFGLDSVSWFPIARGLRQWIPRREAAQLVVFFEDQNSLACIRAI